MNLLSRSLKRPLLHVAGLSFFVNLLLLVPAIFMLQVFDRVLSSQSGDTLLVLMLGTAVALALLLALDYLRSRLQGVAGNIVGEALSPVVTKIAIAQGARRTGKAAGDGLRDVGAVRALFSAQGLIALFDAPWVVVYVGVIWLAHPWLGMAAAAAAVVMLGLAVLNDVLTRRAIEQVQGAASGTQRYLEGSLANAEVAQVLGMTDALIAHWRHKNEKVSALQRPVAARSVAMAALTRTFRQSVQVLMLGLGAWLVISGEATAGVMIATTVLLSRALAPVEQVVGSWKMLAEGRAALRRLSELLDSAAAEPQRMQLPTPAGHLQAQGVVFRPEGSDRVLLAGVSFALPAGESLAIVGPSGAGKSTLLRVLTGIWKPAAGTVRLDNADLTQWPREDLGHHIGYVPQDVELFAGSVAENIARLGEVDAQRVLAAAVSAGVHDMILGLPEGYDTMVDPASAVLSPGQRQRIALARALYGEPRLVILDEPNSNLDGAGEAALADTLKGLKGRATVVVVTHRTTLTQHVDKMLVLEAGRVAHFGPREDVLRAMQGGAPRGGVPGGARVVPMPRPAAAAAAGAMPAAVGDVAAAAFGAAPVGAAMVGAAAGGAGRPAARMAGSGLAPPAALGGDTVGGAR
jgi:PrtD family type I secretion system ABC transporter